jgi:hypothetical protein
MEKNSRHLIFSACTGINMQRRINFLIKLGIVGKYADDLVLLAKEEKVLQDVIDKRIEIGGCYGMKMNVKKTKVMRISRHPLPVKIMIEQKQLENVESFKCLGSILTNDGKCTCEIKCRIVMAKAAFNKKMALFVSTLDLEMRKKLVKCYI